MSRRATLAFGLLVSSGLFGCRAAPEPPAVLARPLQSTAATEAKVKAEQDTAAKPAEAVAPTTAPATAPATGKKTTTTTDDFTPPKALGNVAGQALDAEELLVEVYGLLGRDLLMVVDRLVAAKLAVAEASRLGLRLDVEPTEAAVETARLEVLAEFRQRFPGMSYGDVVRNELGVRPDVHTARLRQATIRRLLTERVIRATTLGLETAAVRLIVCASVAEAEAKLARVRGGEDFAAIAAEAEDAPTGGRVPFLVDDERSPLARAVFQLAPGELGGPFAVEDRYVLARLESRRTPLEGRWAEIGAQVEESLIVDGIEEAEFLHWHLSMEDRYAVDLAPIAALLGLATGDEPGDDD